jgi:hypothetical protein
MRGGQGSSAPSCGGPMRSCSPPSAPRRRFPAGAAAPRGDLAGHRQAGRRLGGEAHRRLSRPVRDRRLSIRPLALIDGDRAAQTHRVFDNLRLVLKDYDLSMDDVIKSNLYLLDAAVFPAMNAVSATRFAAPCPARTTVAVAAFPLGARVEIELVARKG